MPIKLPSFTTPAWYQKLSTREQRLVVASFAGITIYLLYLVGGSFIPSGSSSADVIRSLNNQEKEVVILARKYLSLKSKRDSIQDVFVRSQLTFEQVSQELDKMIRGAIGNDNYDLKRSPTAGEFGLGFKRQDFQISLKDISLAQLVGLLGQFDRREKPIFLTKLDVSKNSGAEGSLSAAIEVFTIGK